MIALMTTGFRSHSNTWESWPGEVPAIHVFIKPRKDTLMPATSAGMTPRG